MIEINLSSYLNSLTVIKMGILGRLKWLNLSNKLLEIKLTRPKENKMRLTKLI